MMIKFLLTRPSRDVTVIISDGPKPAIISTHTPLAGRDKRIQAAFAAEYNFYSHAPRGT